MDLNKVDITICSNQRNAIFAVFIWEDVPYDCVLLYGY